MNCENARTMILSDEPVDGSLREHLSMCPECRCLAVEWKSLKGLKPEPAEPSGTLDFKIKEAAAASISGRKHRHRTLVRRIALYASAACCVLITWFAVGSLHNQTKLEQYSKIWKSIEIEKELLVFMTELEISIQSINETLFPENSDPELEISMPDLPT